MPLHAIKGIVPTLCSRVFVAPSGAVIGDVVIGEDSSVWFGTVVRGDMFPIRIGSRTNLQDNTVVHVTGGKAATFVGDEVTVGHGAILHGCTIGSRCLIGMGSVVLDGAVVEDECFVAAGSLVPPGMRVRSRSLVMGRPAKVIRLLQDADLAQIAESSAIYVQYAGEYRESLVAPSCVVVGLDRT